MKIHDYSFVLKHFPPEKGLNQRSFGRSSFPLTSFKIIVYNQITKICIVCVMCAQKTDMTMEKKPRKATRDFGVALPIICHWRNNSRLLENKHMACLQQFLQPPASFSENITGVASIHVLKGLTFFWPHSFLQSTFRGGWLWTCSHKRNFCIHMVTNR